MLSIFQYSSSNIYIDVNIKIQYFNSNVETDIVINVNARRQKEKVNSTNILILKPILIQIPFLISMSTANPNTNAPI